MILEQVRLLEQRRLQQQRELLQQQLSAPAPVISGPLGLAALASKYPLSSALLESFKDGSPAAAAPTVAASVTPPRTQVSDVILRELQLKLVQGGSAVEEDSLQQAIIRLMGGGANAGILDAARLQAASANVGAPSAPSLSSLNFTAPSLPATREELFRQSVANSGSRTASIPSCSLNDLSSILMPNLQQQQLLASLSKGARKRDAAHLQEATAATTNEGRKCLTKKLRRSPPSIPTEEPIDRKEKLALAAAAVEMNERAEAARMIASLAYPPSNTKRKFPLPSEKGDGIAPTAPKMNSFRQAWDNVKSKTMRKEIFLRKLHAGSLFQGSSLRSSSSAPTSLASGRNSD